MNDIQKQKKNYRQSGKWKKLKNFKKKEQGYKCFICGEHLPKGAELHHLDLNPEHYFDIRDPENYVYLCKTCHNMVHAKLKSYLNNKQLLNNFKKVLEEMIRINNLKSDDKNT